MSVQNFNWQEISWRNLKLGMTKIQNLASPMLLDNPLSESCWPCFPPFHKGSATSIRLRAAGSAAYISLLLLPSQTSCQMLTAVPSLVNSKDRSEIFFWFLISVCLEKCDLRLTFIMAFCLIIWPLNKPKIHMKPQRFLEVILRKNKAGGSITIPDFKMYYNAIISKMVWCWHKMKLTDQWNRIKKPEIHLISSN